MDSHPKKKKKTSTEQIRNQSTVMSLVEKTKYSPYKAKANQTPLPNIAIQICLSKKKKKKNPIQRKPNPRRRANQTHGETVTSLAGVACSVARRPRLVVVARPPLAVARPPLVVARREGLVADRRRSQIGARLLRC